MFKNLYTDLPARIAAGRDAWVPSDQQMQELGHVSTDGEQTLPAVIDQARFAPCGYCRRCAIHDDPGGCLVVEDYERELLASGITPREILVASMGEDFVTDAMVEGYEGMLQRLAEADARIAQLDTERPA